MRIDSRSSEVKQNFIRLICNPVKYCRIGTYIASSFKSQQLNESRWNRKNVEQTSSFFKHSNYEQNMITASNYQGCIKELFWGVKLIPSTC